MLSLFRSVQIKVGKNNCKGDHYSERIYYKMDEYLKLGINKVIAIYL